ncbi:putative Translation initiation factor IF-2 [Giardia muris]|uniref:Eukaryotic translation initiation factor 5B n=1 Tax=Giardia muris TaxID=5742 RepID=A0A4Z1TB28_GIAMU|nr:putative Translation initiation factor IF-2 [Giardia muris]|eukprot:TNJ29739.1 putative Translation initiation factor IF-2 [Giardia muris]
MPPKTFQQNRHNPTRKEIEQQMARNEKAQKAGERKPKEFVPPPKIVPKPGALSKKELLARIQESKAKHEKEEREKQELEEKQKVEEINRSGKTVTADGEAHAMGPGRRRQRGRRDDGPGLLGVDIAKLSTAEREELMNDLRTRFAETRAREEAEAQEWQRLARERAQLEEEKMAAAREKKKTWEDMSSGSSFELDKEVQERKPEQKKSREERLAEVAKEERAQELAKARADNIQENLRSPICAVLGHVDTGKTSLLDKIRSTNVQNKEIGGITQQIGSTFFSYTYLQERTREFPHKIRYKIPGLLIVDTPGHEAFANLRSRGSSLADIAILVVDIMHGLEPQTIESIHLLRERNCPFVVALNKIDRLYNWKEVQGRSSKSALAGCYEIVLGKEKPKDAVQDVATLNDFEKRFDELRAQFGNLDLDVDLWWRVENFATTIPVVPTSAKTEEGIPDLLAMLVSFTQRLMENKITIQYTEDGKEEMQCTVLEVRKEDGLGFTIDCILVNGELRRNDQVVLASLNGPVVTRVKELLTPQEAREIRERGTSNYKHNDSLRASIGFKLFAADLEFVIPGTPMLRIEPGDDVDDLKECVMDELMSVNDRFKRCEVGVHINSSSLGSMEALLSYLQHKETKIPVSGCAIGPITKGSIQEASLQNERGKPEYACILAFDIEVDKQTEDYAKFNKVKIFSAGIIYHLYDMFTKHLRECFEAKRDSLKDETVFPCVLQIIDCFHNKDPLILGVRVEKGRIMMKQPLCFKGGRPLGRVEGIQKDGNPLPEARAGMEVAIRINTADNSITYGRTFSISDTPHIYAHMTRQSIDILKEFYREDLSKDEWGCVKQLRDMLCIPAGDGKAAE